MKKFKIVLILVFILINIMLVTYGEGVTAFEDRFKVLELLKVFDNDNNLDELMSRSEFAKYIVKISPHKDLGTDYEDIVTKNGYMYRSISGDFRGDEIVRYNDVSRACLALLGYTNDDFKGNQVSGRNAKFKELYLNDNIYKQPNDYFTKRDVINVIYNTLRTEEHEKNTEVTDNSKLDDDALGSDSDEENKNNKKNTVEQNAEEQVPYKSITELIENSTNKISNTSNILSNKVNILSNISNKKFYGNKIFDKLKLKLNNELNADAYIERDLDGPYIVKPGTNFTSKFEITDNNIFINGIRAKKTDLEFDIGAYGFALIYYDNTNSMLYAYTFREDIESNVYLRKDYVNEVYYNPSDMTKPYKLMIGNNKYFIDNEEMKVMFSPSGKYREGDQILFIASKYLDKDSYSQVDITFDEENKRYHFYNDSTGREIYYDSSDNKWYYDVIIENDSELGYWTSQHEYTGSFFARGYDDEHISGGLIYAMKY